MPKQSSFAKKLAMKSVAMKKVKAKRASKSKILVPRASAAS